MKDLDKFYMKYKKGTPMLRRFEVEVRDGLVTINHDYFDEDFRGGCSLEIIDLEDLLGPEGPTTIATWMTQEEKEARVLEAARQRTFPGNS